LGLNVLCNRVTATTSPFVSHRKQTENPDMAHKTSVVPHRSSSTHIKSSTSSSFCAGPQQHTTSERNSSRGDIQRGDLAKLRNKSKAVFGTLSTVQVVSELQHIHLSSTVRKKCFDPYHSLSCCFFGNKFMDFRSCDHHRPGASRQCQLDL